MKETFGQKTRRSHKRNQRVVMFWCAFVFAFVIAGVWLFRGTLFQNDSGASSSGTNQSRHDACGTADSRQKSTDVTQAPMDHEVWQKLQDLVSQDQRVQQVIDNCEIYPEDILKMLSRNLDMLNFVLEYPEKVGQVFAETVGEVEGGEVPLLLQYDQRWGYGDYGNSSVAVSGCGPACLRHPRGPVRAQSLGGLSLFLPLAVPQPAEGVGDAPALPPVLALQVPLESNRDVVEQGILRAVLLHQPLVPGQGIPLLHRLGPVLVPWVGQPEAGELIRPPGRF